VYLHGIASPLPGKTGCRRQS